MLIDSHAHLITDKFDYKEIIERMKTDGIDKIIAIGTNYFDSEQNIEIAKENTDVYCTVGIHPEYASEYDDTNLLHLLELGKHEKVVALVMIIKTNFTNRYNLFMFT